MYLQGGDYDAEPGYPDPFKQTPSTGTSLLSSMRLPLGDEPEEESLAESSQEYRMGPVLRAMLEEFDKGDELLKKDGGRKKSHS